MLRKKHRHSGFSLAEAAIALAVIAIVSLASISIVITSADIEKNTMLTASVISDAENVVDCFEFAGTLTELEESLTFIADWYSLSDYDTGTAKLQLTRDNYIINLTVFYTAATDGENTVKTLDMFIFEAINRSAETVYQFDYRKSS